MADASVITQESLPPVEYLIMETLAARHRLGEDHWTFPNRVKAHLASLSGRGLIIFKSATIYGYQVAWLTDEGRACCLSETYRLPGQRVYEDLLGAIWLYIPWRYVTKHLTTEQKTLFADAVDADAVQMHDGIGEPSKVERWWQR